MSLQKPRGGRIIWPRGEGSERYTVAPWSPLLEPQPLHHPPLGLVRCCLASIFNTTTPWLDFWLRQRDTHMHKSTQKKWKTPKKKKSIFEKVPVTLCAHTRWCRKVMVRLHIWTKFTDFNTTVYQPTLCQHLAHLLTKPIRRCLQSFLGRLPIH